MNYLKNAVGLLNAQAPEGEFLAYINPSEAKMLKDAGGAGLLTPQGIPSYFTAAQAATGGAAGGQAMSPGTSTTGGSRNTGGSGNNNNNNNNNPPSPGDTGGEGGNNPQDNSTTQFNNSFNNNDDIDSTYTDTSFDVTPEKSAMDQLKDFISSGGIIGNTFKAISNFADNFNKNRRNKFMSTADIKEYELGTGKNWNPNNVTDKNSDEYKYLKNETNYFQQFNNDNNRNEDDLSTFFDDPQDATIQNFSNNPNPFSQVDNYFSNNMGTNNLGMSNNFMTSYDQAKADLAKTLNMTTNASQFGYNANMSSSNIYYNYLKEQGLL